MATVDYDIMYTIREDGAVGAVGEDGGSLVELKALIQARLDDGWTILTYHSTQTSSLDIQHIVWYLK